MAVTRFNSLVCLVFLLLTFGCTEKNRRAGFPGKPLSEGDIVFRRGVGLASRAVLTVDRKGGGYSHVGIVVNDCGIWKVVHAVPGESENAGDPDRVKMETVETFFADDKAGSGAVMRVDTTREVHSKAARLALRLYRERILFDHRYDKEDTTEMYCTELVEFVYMRAGLDLVGKKCSEIDFPGFSGLYLLPSDIQNSRYLRLMDSF